MKLSTLTAVVLAASTSTAFAAGPVQMSEAQLDKVAAGGLIDVVVVDVVDVRNVKVAIPVNAAVAIAALGAAAGAVATQPGNINQRR